MTTPIVSCIMPTGHRTALAGRAIEYWKRQTLPPDQRELIIVTDDPDSMKDWNTYGEGDIVVLVKERPKKGNRSMLENMAQGMKVARGEYVAIWEDDDWYAEHRLDLQLKRIIEADVDMVGIGHIIYYNIYVNKYVHIPSPGHTSHCGMLFKRDAVASYFDYASQTHSIFCDIEMSRRAEMHGGLVLMDNTTWPFVVGIKHSTGYGSGHKPFGQAWKGDSGWTVLTEVIGEQDTMWYQENMDAIRTSTKR